MPNIPWTKDSPPSPAMNKSEHLREVCVLAANAALSKGQTQDEAVFACISAMKRATPSVELTKQKPRAIPQHLAAVLNKAVSEPSSGTSNAADTTQQDSGIATADFDTNGHLVITMHNGERIITKNKAVEEHIQQSNIVQVNPVFDYVRFNTEVNKPPYEQGLLFYDKEDHSLSYYNDDSNVTVNIGREQLIRVYNNTSVALQDGKAVYVNGASTGWPTVTLAKADSVIASQSTIGLVTGEILPSEYGYVCTSGVVHGLNTSMFTAGDIIYLDAAVAGNYTNVKPLQPNYNVELGTVLVSSSTEGRIFVQIDKKAWFPSIELLEDRTDIVLPTVPTVFKPHVQSYNDGFTYDISTGELTVNNSASYGVSIQINAIPSSSNKYVYFYVEEDTGSGWQIKRYSARKMELINAQESELLVNADRYYAIGTKLRFVLWGDSTITLRSTDLPGTTPGTVTLPAYRFLMAG